MLQQREQPVPLTAEINHQLLQVLNPLSEQRNLWPGLMLTLVLARLVNPYQYTAPVAGNLPARFDRTSENPPPNRLLRYAESARRLRNREPHRLIGGLLDHADTVTQPESTG